MPEPSTHAAAGIGAGYFIGTMVAGLNPDFLVIGAVGALIAAGRQPVPEFSVKKYGQTITALSNIAVVSLVSASATSILVVKITWAAALGIPIAALIGVFGQPLIAATTEIIANSYRLLAAKVGGKE